MVCEPAPFAASVALPLIVQFDVHGVTKFVGASSDPSSVVVASYTLVAANVSGRGVMTSAPFT